MGTLFQQMLEMTVAELPPKLLVREQQVIVEAWLLGGSVAAPIALETLDALNPVLQRWDKMREEDRVMRFWLTWQLFTFVMLFRFGLRFREMPDKVSLSFVAGPIIRSLNPNAQPDQGWTAKWANLVFGFFYSPDEQQNEGIRDRLGLYLPLSEQMGVSEIAANDLIVLLVHAIIAGDRGAMDILQAAIPHIRDHNHFPVRDAIDAQAVGLPSLHPTEAATLSMALSQADEAVDNYIRSEL